jgi:asparagine synthase (glutamine-hydrolysing)
MSDESGRWSITFNGEIFNFRELRPILERRGHVLRSRTDTEVLLKLFVEFGPACLSMLSGMFAFAIWDEAERRLFIARDRIGKKPLFYFATRELFVFASEPKALFQHPEVPRQLCRQKLAEYLSLRYVCAPDTLYEGISKLPPAHRGVLIDGRLRMDRYWSPPPVPDSPSPMVRGTVDEVRDRLRDAVRSRMIADVPVGVFLSGGLDSSLVTALMVRESPGQVRSYSVGFDDPAVSELPHARAIAEHCGTRHCELVVRPADIVEHLPAVIRARDVPASEAADVPIFLLARRARADVKVVLSGEGADEIFGGYYKYLFEPFSARYRSVPSAIRRVVERVLPRLPGRLSGLARYARAAGEADPNLRSLLWFASEPDPLGVGGRLGGVSPRPPQWVVDECALLGYTGARQASFFDVRCWLPDNLLERADRLTMAASLELRTPFLDHEIVEYCFLLDERAKALLGRPKRLLRRAAVGLVPCGTISRWKSGFSTPMSRWMRSELRDWVGDLIHSGDITELDESSGDALRRLFEDHITGRADNGKALWGAVTLATWLREGRAAAGRGAS